LFAGGERPWRNNERTQWSIHHIYDGQFPFEGRKKTLHAVKKGKHFTQSAGLIAVHPIADALCDEFFYFTWLLRKESYTRFGYDPDHIFSEDIDELGFES
jgi:hypothetical protein